MAMPDVDDQKKLNWIIYYLQGTKTVCLMLEANNLQVMKWWVDTLFAVYKGMCSDTSATMYLGITLHCCIKS